MKTIYPSSWPATNKFVRDTCKGKTSNFRTFITHNIWYLHLQLAEIQSQGEERGLCFICPGNEIHSNPQWAFLTTVSGTYNTLLYPSVSGGETLGRWEPVMNETSSCVRYIFLISIKSNSDVLKWIPPAERTKLTQQAKGNTRGDLAVIPQKVTKGPQKVTRVKSR